MKTLVISLAGVATFALVSCENPADNSSAAKTGAAKDVPTGSASGAKWVFTEDSKIDFVGSKVTGSHDGGFKSFSGHFHVDGDTLAESGHQIEIDMNSTWSDNDKLTEHLKAPDFFNVEKFPTSSFIATGLRESKDGEKGTHQLTGNFKLHGVEKSIEFPVTVTQSEGKLEIDADFFINRFDYDIKYEGMKDDLIRKEVVIKLDLTAVPAG
jgi:polyisoprenoid-binding protein YceI